MSTSSNTNSEAENYQSEKRIMKFRIPGVPRGKGRPRFHRFGKNVVTYTSTDTAVYENLIKLSYVEQCGVMLEGPIFAKILGIFPVPESTSKKKRKEMLEGTIKYTKKIDCDNLAKTILDSLNGVAYADDKQVCELWIKKQYGEIPMVEVTLMEL